MNNFSAGKLCNKNLNEVNVVNVKEKYKYYYFV